MLSSTTMIDRSELARLAGEQGVVDELDRAVRYDEAP
jgi:hypothetical protein